MHGAGAIEKLHGYYQQFNSPSDPETFQKEWDATVDKGWPTVELIGIRTPSEAKHWQKVVAMGGEDVGAIPEPVSYTHLTLPTNREV